MYHVFLLGWDSSSFVVFLWNYFVIASLIFYVNVCASNTWVSLLFKRVF